MSVPMNLGTTIKVAGGLLPPQLLERIAAGDSTLVGTAAADFHEENTVALNQAINRAWSVLTARWATFRAQLAQLMESDRATVLTREKWLLPLFQELGYGRLAPERAAIVADDRPFAISHRWGHVPIHLVGARISLDKRVPGERGAAASPPHGLVQDLLNHADGHLWALLSNGLELRLLRDHRSLTRQAYISFDLEAMFDGEQFSAFRLLYLLCHQSRVEGDDPRQCWLERWMQHAQDDGVRALDRLRSGVEAALTALGRGFIRHRANDALNSRLRSGALTTQDYYRQLLKLVYRLIFLFVAEDRDLLLVPDAPEAAKERFRRLYATRRLRTLATRRRGGPHEDGWQAVVLVMRQLDKGNESLALPALGSFLWSTEDVGGKRVSRAIPDLDGASLANEDLYAALAALCVVQDGPVRRPVDWAGVQSDELGSVYEALMERVPRVNLAAGSFELASAAGNERKTTGSYYTPSSLVDCLLDSALDPVLEEAARSAEPEKAILDLAVVDPACGSGHFLVAAARRIAHRLARVRCGGIEPSPPEVQHALRDVVGHCIYGVDLNPMAVELCKVSLWMEAIEPGKPLSFLDGHIRHGNALLGTTPELMEKGIPDEAWEAIEGDDKDVAKRLKKQNRNWKQTGLFGAKPVWDTAALAKRAAEVEAADDTTAAAVEQKEQAWRKLDDAAADARLLADVWCAAFVWPKQPGEAERAAPVRGVWETVKQAPASVSDATRRIAKELAKQYAFFHWHLAFPRVFERGGFDVVLGNPPWKTIESTDDLSSTDQRTTAATQRFVGVSGLFPDGGSGRKNLYALFVERAAALGKHSTDGHVRSGAVGLLIPTELCQGADTESLSRRLFESRRVQSLFDFQNRRPDGSRWFPDVHPQYRFCLLTLCQLAPKASFAFDLDDTRSTANPQKCYELSAEDVLSFCGSESFRVPMFLLPRDAAVMASAYSRASLLGQSQTITSGLMFNFGKPEKVAKCRWSDAAFRAGFVPVLEGENFHQYDHRYAVFVDPEGVVNPNRAIKEEPKLSASGATGLPASMVHDRIAQMAGQEWTGNWLLLLRRQARANDSYISIAAIVPACAVEGSATVFFGPKVALVGLLWTLNSLLINFVLARRQSGPNVNKGLYGLLPLRKQVFAAVAGAGPWSKHLLELTYTAWDLEPFAKDVGYDGPPFRWDPARRFLLRCELDAAFFHLYGLSRDDTDYILDTFPIVRKNDEKAHGEYRTKRVILEIYDAMAEAIRTGIPYQTRLDPPPADPRVAHPPRTHAEAP